MGLDEPEVQRVFWRESDEDGDMSGWPFIAEPAMEGADDDDADKRRGPAPRRRRASTANDVDSGSE